MGLGVRYLDEKFEEKFILRSRLIKQLEPNPIPKYENAPKVSGMEILKIERL